MLQQPDSKEPASVEDTKVPTMRKISEGITEQQKEILSLGRSSDLGRNDCLPPANSFPLRSRKLSSLIGREILVEKVRQALGLETRREAARVASAVISCVEDTLVENLETDGFSIKLYKFGKLSVRHRPASLRRIPLTGETKITSRKRRVKLVVLGKLRKLEKARASGRSGETPRAWK